MCRMAKIDHQRCPVGGMDTYKWGVGWPMTTFRVLMSTFVRGRQAAGLGRLGFLIPLLANVGSLWATVRPVYIICRHSARPRIKAKALALEIGVFCAVLAACLLRQQLMNSPGRSLSSTLYQVVQAAVWRPVQIKVAKVSRNTVSTSMRPTSCL